jgi:2-polyprenyl-6-methoxyphenol hydroxylase-like FAD-dependent oxidoreductase
MDNHEVFIAGAGPTGLVTALWLRRLGVRVRIVDKADRPGTTSRAVAVQARTLELYRQVGLADDVLARGLDLGAVNLWVRGRHVGRAPFGDIGKGLSPFPFVLMYPQDEHETLLADHLARAGVTVERGVELLDFDERDGRVNLRTRDREGREREGQAAYLVGADGAHSTVRQRLGIGFPGGTYERVFYVADVKMRGPVADPGSPDRSAGLGWSHELHVALDDADLVAVFPLRGQGSARLIGTIRREAEGAAGLTWNDISHRAVERMRLTVDEVNWFSTYRVHHRVADQVRSGRAVLVGDAGHIHSPVGGQGMNTGIGDGINLAWKLAQVLSGQADARLLDSYEPERIAFARRLVATTDRAFTLVNRDGGLARLIRLGVVPRLLPGLTSRTAVRRFMFRAVSQTVINYRHSDLSAGHAGKVRGGDRLPWVPLVDVGAAGDAAGDVGAAAGDVGVAAAGAGNVGAAGEPGGTPVHDRRPDNFAPLASLRWQVHVYGEAGDELRAAAERRGLPLHAFPWDARFEAAGLARDATYLIRPDGHVGLADPHARPETLERYLEALGLQQAPAPTG